MAKVIKKTTKKTRVVKTTRVVRSGGDEVDQNPLGDWFRKYVAFRICIAEIPIMILVGIAMACHVMLYVHETYLHTFIAALHFTPERMEREETYPRVECEIDDLTTLEPGPLILGENQTSLDATENVLLHGASLFPRVVSPKTANNLRNYVLKRSRELKPSEKVDVIMNDYRTSFTLSATEHPSVANALMEISNNQRLSETLENLMGPDPSLMEFQVIIAREGAAPQYFHADSPPRTSAISFAYTFGPLYTFLTPLQDTTPEMGPTAVCPGSHRCYYTPSCYGFGTDIGNNVTEQVGFQAVDPTKGYWEAGTGLLYSSSTAHRGTGHSRGVDRVVLILSFATRPDHVARPSLYSRYPPLNSVYALRWYLMGSSLSDLRDPYNKMTPSLTRWTGLWGSYSKLSWNSFRFDLFRTADSEQYRFGAEELQADQDKMKGLMGTLSKVLLLPVKQAEGYTDTEYHAKRIVERLRMVCFSLAFLLSSIYIALIIQTNKSWIPWSLARFLALVAILYGLAKSYQKEIDESEWAQDILNGNLAKGPPEIKNEIPFSETYADNLPTPTAQDVLVDTLSSKLNSQQYLLDYIPGNRRWHSTIQDMAYYFLQYEGFRDSVVDHAVSLTRTRAGHTFFKKNDIGDFLEMADVDLRELTNNVMVQQLVDPQKRLGYASGKFKCKGDGLRSLCKLVPQSVANLFSRPVAKDSMISPSKSTSTISRTSHSHDAIPPRKDIYSCVSKKLEGIESPAWEEGDVVQVQMDRMGKAESRKWINAKIIKERPDGTFDVEAFSIDSHKKFGVSGDRLRTQWKSEVEPYGMAWRKYTSRAGLASGAKCFPGLALPEQSTGSMFLNETYPISTRDFLLPASTNAVEIDFYVEEYGSDSGSLSLLLGDQELDFKSIDPKIVESNWSGLLDNVEASIIGITETKDHVKLLVPSNWFQTDKLFFGLEVSEGLSLKVYNLQANAVRASTEKTAVAQWDPEPVQRLETDGALAAREYSVPGDAEQVEIDFDFLETGETAGLLTIKLADVQIDLREYDPKQQEEGWSGYFYDAHASVTGTSLTTNHIRLVVPATWLKDNVLLFGAGVEDGLSGKIYNIKVNAVSASGSARLIRYRPAM